MAQIIGIYSSHPGCGKTTLARKIKARDKQTVRVAFADTLKAMAKVMLIELGYNHRDADRLVQKDKHEPVELLDGRVTMRHALQQLGTEWGRNSVHPELWLRCWTSKARRALENGYAVLADDVRFPNEAQVVRDLGGVLVRVERTCASTEFSSHASEGALDEWDFDLSIDNNGDIRGLDTAAEMLVHDIDIIRRRKSS